MKIEIRETKIVEDAGGALVQLHISDKPLDAPDAKFSLLLATRIDEMHGKWMLANIQLSAVQAAQRQLLDVEASLKQSMKGQEIPEGYKQV